MAISLLFNGTNIRMPGHYGPIPLAPPSRMFRAGEDYMKTDERGVACTSSLMVLLCRYEIFQSARVYANGIALWCKDE